MTTELVQRDPQTGNYLISDTTSGFEMKPRTLEEAMRFCELMANSDLVPNAYRGKPGNIMVAIQMGNELGLTPMRALRCIAVINGRASMWGDELLAMVLASPVCEYVDESLSDAKQGVCKTKRKGCAEQVSTFTLDDAKRAGLLGKQGPWQTNTNRMLKLRARGFGLRDTFADVLAGLVSAEEALDLPRIESDDPKVNILDAAQPLTLKDKLKAKVEAVAEPAPAPAPADPRQEDGLKSVDESGPTSRDAPAPEETVWETPPGRTVGTATVTIATDPAEPYKAKLRVAHTAKELNSIYAGIPETIRQDCWSVYNDRLKAMGKK